MNVDKLLKFNFDIKNWKMTGLATLAAAVLFAMINSILFSIVIALLKIVMAVVILLGICWTVFLLYPTIEKKVKEKIS